MLGLLFIAALFVILHRNRPDKKSFEQFYLGSKSTILRWVGKLVIPPYDFYDLFVVALVFLPDGTMFIGILGNWLLIIVPDVKNQEHGVEVDFDIGFKMAMRLKGEKQYTKAMEAFIKAAKIAKGDLEEADCWREAAQCAKMIKNDNVLTYQERAAQLYLKGGKLLRAANLYESMGRLQEAIDIYEQIGDGRAETLQADLADTLARSKRWSEAQQAWERAAQSAIKDPLLTPMARRRMFLAGLCAMAAETKVTIPEWLEGTSEAAVLRNDANSDRLVGKMATLPDWATTILNNTNLR